MKFLLLTVLAVQAGAATAPALNLWPQTAAVPPGSNTTAITETVTSPPAETPTTLTVPAATTPAGSVAIAPVPVAAPGQALPEVNSTVPTGGVSAPAFGGQAPGMQRQAPTGAAGPEAVSRGGGTPAPMGNGPTSSETGGNTPDGDSDIVAAAVPRETQAHSDHAALTGSAGIAAAPGRIVIGISNKKAPRAKTVAIWTDNPGDVLTVTPQKQWIKATAGKPKKGARTYDITVDTTALPPGRIHDGVVRVGGPGGVLDVRVTVEFETLR